MKIIIFSLVLFSLAFPVFSQDASAQRRTALSEAMNATITRSTTALADFDSRITVDATARVYAAYFRRHSFLAADLHESGAKLDLLLRGNAHTTILREERNTYERLLRELEAVKTDYENWLRTVP